MDESVYQPAAIMMLLLFFGGLGALLIVKRHLKEQPVDVERVAKLISRRAFSTKQFTLFALGLLLLYFLAGCTGLLFFDGYIPEEDKPQLQLLIQWMLYALLAGLFLIINRPRRKRFGMSAKNLRWFPIGMGFYFAAIPIIFTASFVYRLLLSLILGSEIELQEITQYVRGDWSWLKVSFIFTAVIAAPIYEEIIFRGILFPFILKLSNVKTAIIFTAVLFAAIHLHLPSLLPIALLSVLLCYAYLRTASIWTCIGMHMMFNAMSIFALNLIG